MSLIGSAFFKMLRKRRGFIETSKESINYLFNFKIQLKNNSEKWQNQSIVTQPQNMRLRARKIKIRAYNFKMNKRSMTNLDKLLKFPHVLFS